MSTYTTLFLSIFELVMCITEISSFRDAANLQLFVTEELRKGTIIAAGSDLENLFPSNLRDPPRIINQGDPGVSCFMLKFEPDSKVAPYRIQLVVTDRLDREVVCPKALPSKSQNSDFSMQSGSTEFQIESSPNTANLYKTDFASKGLQDQDCPITLRVASTDGREQYISQIIVYVQDINDNPPIWTDSSIVICFKDGDTAGTKHILPLATDADHGRNAIITYRLHETELNLSQSFPNLNNLHNSECFELQKFSEASGQIGDRLYLVSKCDIDREIRPQGWRLVLYASNIMSGETKPSMLTIHVKVTDVNDNAPKFSQSIYQPQLPNYKVGVVPETIPIGQTIIHLHATDADEGVNAAVSYDFSEGPQTSSIKHFFKLTESGDLVVKQRLQLDNVGQDPLSHILPDSLSFDVIAIDGADPAYAKSGTATVSIHIEDVDDEPPIIRVHPIRKWSNSNSTRTENETDLAVSENDSIGQLLAIIETKDPDKHGIEVIRCALTGNSSEKFRLTQKDLSRNEYLLVLASQLDREEIARVQITIECRDMAEHQSQHRVVINVLDVNDHAPRFEKKLYNFAVYETDGESNIDGFNMHSSRWETDSGKVYVKALDEDEGHNKRITYHLDLNQDGSNNTLFSVDSETGEIYVVGILDREDNDQHRFTVLAIDEGTPRLTGTCIVQVRVLDVNDNAPIFTTGVTTTGSYLFTIMENQLPGKKVGQVEAYDLDLLPPKTGAPFTETVGISKSRNSAIENGERLTYGLKMNEGDAKHFWIDPKSGLIITRSILDREQQAVFTFHVTVRDGPARWVNSPPVIGGHVHEVSAVVTVTVDDENDNDPVFVRPNSTNHMVLLEPAAIPGQSVIQLLATDPDDGINGLVTYAIKSGNGGNLFNVDTKTGLIYLENPIPRRTISEATAAANAAASMVVNRFANIGQSMNRNVVDHQVLMPTHPTFLLSLEACDQGEPKRCSHFPNLQIQLRVPADISLPFNSDDPSLKEITSSGHFLLNPELLNANSNSLHGRNAAFLSIIEIVVITLSVFFSLVIITVVFVVCILKRKSVQIKGDSRYKHGTPTVGNHSGQPRACTTRSLMSGKNPGQDDNCLNNRKMTEDSEFGTLTRAGIHFKSNPMITDGWKFANPVSMPQYVTQDDCSLINSPIPENRYLVPDQYQSLEAWSNTNNRHLGFRPIPYSMEFHQVYSSQTEQLQLRENFGKSYEEPDDVSFDIEYERFKENPDHCHNPVSSNGAKSQCKAYSGLPKSSFV